MLPRIDPKWGGGEEMEKVKSDKDRKFHLLWFFFLKFQFIDMIITIEVTAEFHYFRSGEWKFIGLFMLKVRVICSKYPGGKKIALCLWGVIIVFTVSTINLMQDITDNWKQKLNILSLGIKVKAVEWSIQVKWCC